MTSKQLLLSIDQGTTSSRVILFDSEGNSWPQVQRGHKQIFPNAGWCEHDPMEILNVIYSLIEELVSKMPSYGLNASDIRAIGITNQRETTIVWDKYTGKPLYNAIVWHDTRTASMVDHLIEVTGSQFAFSKKTGLPFSTYFRFTLLFFVHLLIFELFTCVLSLIVLCLASVFKLKWLIENVPQVKKAIAEQRCLFGTMDSWLIWVCDP